MDMIHLSDWKQTSFRAQLSELYGRLDSVNLTSECGSRVRSDFFRKARGEFIRVLKMKRAFPDDQLANFLKISSEAMLKIQKGQTDINDVDFFNLCIYLGCANEISIFIEKMENALRPGLREARASAKATLRLYGIRLSEVDDPRGIC